MELSSILNELKQWIYVDALKDNCKIWKIVNLGIVFVVYTEDSTSLTIYSKLQIVD